MTQSPEKTSGDSVYVHLLRLARMEGDLMVIAAEQRLTGQVDDLHLHQLSNIAWSFAQEGYTDPQGFCASVAGLAHAVEQLALETDADEWSWWIKAFIDDATGQLMHLRFGETESAYDYMLATREYIEKHGKPLVFYSDKHGVFRVYHPNGAKTGTTQFGRLLHDIGVDLICANSPQAKGRVERANQTLQDRLIKEMRLEGISSIEQANAWIEIFIGSFNARFARVPRYPKNLHRPVTESDEELGDMFAWQETRKLTKSLTFRYDKIIYLVEPTEENSRLAGENIMVYDYPDGTLAFKYGHRSLKYWAFDKLDCIDQGKIVDNKRLGAVLKLAQDKMDELDRQGKRERSKKMPKRRAQARVQEQLRAINPVLVNPEEFRASLTR